MALPIDVAQNIKAYLENEFEGLGFAISIYQPEAETVVVAEAKTFTGEQIGIIEKATLIGSASGWPWFVDSESESGVRVVIW